LAKILRPDKFIKALARMIQQYLGKFYLEPPTLNIETLFKESNNLTPLIFILSPGADARDEILALAEKLQLTDNLISLSLG
jgi:dynein heavy chain